MDPKRMIEKVQARTGIRLNPKDPILEDAAIFEVIVDEAIADLRKMIQASKEQCEYQRAKHLEDSEESAKKTAGVVISQAAEWLSDRFKEAAEATSATILAEVRADLARIEKEKKISVRASWISIGSAVVAVAVAIGWATTALI